MRTNELGVPRSQPAGAANICRAPSPNAHPVPSNERLLGELLAEAHARIRALEEALDRVKKAV